MHRELLGELARLRGQVRAAGANVSKAVGRLYATGQPGGDLEASVRYLVKVAARIDAAAEQARRRL